MIRGNRLCIRQRLGFFLITGHDINVLFLNMNMSFTVTLKYKNFEDVMREVGNF